METTSKALVCSESSLERREEQDAIARELTESSLFRVDLVALRLANNQFQ